MPKVHPITPSMNTGELTPRLAARVDFNKYPSGLATMENLIPLPEGGAMRRAGTRYVAATKTGATVKSRLKKFEFSTSQNYILEMGNYYLRFFRDQGQIYVPNITASITNGTFTSGITSWADHSGAGSSIAYDATTNRLNLISNGTTNGHTQQTVTNSSAIEHVIQFQVIGAPGDYVLFSVGTSSLGIEIVNDFIAEVGYHCYSFTATAADFYVQFINELGKTIQIDNVALLDNVPVELVTPYAEADLYQVEGPQSADILYMFHQSYPTYRLERRGHTTWSLIEVPWQDGPWLSTNDTTTTLTASAATGLGVTITASSTNGINGGSGFLSTDIGRQIRITDETTINWGWGVITSVSGTTTVIVDVERTFATTAAETDWRLGSWSGTTGYPSTGAFFEQRLYAAGNTDQPQTFWASQTGNFEVHSPDSDPTVGTFDGTVQDDDALDFTISADNVNAIRWMSAGEDTLSIGTTGGEWVPSSTGAVITPSDITVRRQTTHGSAQVVPVRVDNIVLFVQRAKRKIREFGFTFETDGYRAFDMTRLAQHITIGGIVEMDHAEEPDSQVWVVRADGQLPAMTFRRQEDVVGWSRHILGGAFGTGDAVVESVSVIAGSNGAGQHHDSTSRDEVWVQVKRTINSATVRYIEMFERDHDTTHDATDAIYSDSCITYSGGSTSTITGLGHLEGQTVKVWANSAIQSDKVVSSGSITLDTASTKVQIGLSFTHKLTTLKIEGGNRAGTSVGKVKRFSGVTFVLLNSHTIEYGPSPSELTKNDLREVSDYMDSGTPLYTGELAVEFDGNWESDPRIYIESDDPAPFTVLAIAPEVKINALI
tara:strand:- start:3025 stop:5511 length:2487 start_codon:yes stop_codon:yes gene_type:complete